MLGDALLRLAFAVGRVRLPIVELIEADPAGFEFGELHAVHRGAGLRIWIASESYGLHYRCWVGEETALQDARDDRLFYGDWGEEVRPGDAERRLIWKAIKGLVESHRRARLRPQVARLQRRIDQVLALRSRSATHVG